MGSERQAAASQSLLHDSRLIMNCLLLYDISDDRKRTQIAETCFDYGLDRIQYSAFSGDISRNYQEELFLKVKAILGKAPGRILLLSICATDWSSQLLHEKGEI